VVGKPLGQIDDGLAHRRREADFPDRCLAAVMIAAISAPSSRASEW